MCIRDSSASGSGLRCFPPTGCFMRSFTRQGIRRNVPSAARSLRQPLTAVSYTHLELEKYIRKSDKAADRLDAAQAAIPKEKKLVRAVSYTHLDVYKRQGLMSSVPLGENLIPIQRGLTTSSTAIFIPFITQELFQSGAALYYGLNALSNNMIQMCIRDRVYIFYCTQCK